MGWVNFLCLPLNAWSCHWECGQCICLHSSDSLDVKCPDIYSSSLNVSCSLVYNLQVFPLLEFWKSRVCEIIAELLRRRIGGCCSLKTSAHMTVRKWIPSIFIKMLTQYVLRNTSIFLLLILSYISFTYRKTIPCVNWIDICLTVFGNLLSC